MNKLFIVVNVDWFFLSHRKEIAIKARDEGFDVTIVTKDTGKMTYIKELGLKTINLPINRSGQNVIEELKTFTFLRRLYKEEKPNIVHHVGLKTIIWGSLAAKIARVKGVINAVSGLGTIFSQESKSIVTSLILLILRFSHKRNNLFVIFQNNEDKSLFLDNHIIRKDQVYMIKGSGVNLEEFNYHPEPISDRIRIVFTARMIVEKGVFILIDAANLLKSKYQSQIQFLLVGGIDDNPGAIEESELKRRCDNEYIKWYGYRSDIVEILKSSHIIAFPSYYKEGLPKSLIEASAIGRPIITTDSIGCKETVIDGYNGFLIPIKNSRILAKKLEQLICNPELRIEMGKNSRILAERDFSIKDVVDKHIKIYKELNTL